MKKENTYIHHINSELLQWMPVVAFEGEVVVVDKPEMVDEAVSYLRTQRVVGVDTEARPSFQRGTHYPTALVQISSRERCYLFRLTHIGMPQALADIFSDPKICRKSESMEEIGSHAMAPSQSWRSPLGERKNRKRQKTRFQIPP